MTSFEEFLVNWKNGIKGVFYVTAEDIGEYHDRDDYEDIKIKPFLQKLNIDENDSDLSESIKYPGDY